MPEHHDRREWAENHWRKMGKDLASVSTGQILVHHLVFVLIHGRHSSTIPARSGRLLDDESGRPGDDVGFVIGFVTPA